jgi:hypothetical protein
MRHEYLHRQTWTAVDFAWAQKQMDYYNAKLAQKELDQKQRDYTVEAKAALQKEVDLQNARKALVR